MSNPNPSNQWKKGQSGNKNGRPPTGDSKRDKLNTLKAIISKELHEITIKEYMELQRVVNWLFMQKRKEKKGRKNYKYCGVYFITDGERVKIGHGLNYKRRFSAIQTGCADKLTVVGFVPCSPDDRFKVEKYLHGKFSNDYIRGEWFTYSFAIEQFLDYEGYSNVPD